MVALGESVVAIELVIAAQAVDLRRPARLGSGTAVAHARVREIVPFLAEGDVLLPDLEPVRALIRTRALGF
jgi:histidine ammonia-lyase